MRLGHSIMADLLFRFVLLINLTGLVTLAAPVIGLPIASVSILLLALNLLYLCYRWPVTWRLLTARSLWPWFVLFLVWPIATVFYTPLVDSRRIGLSVYYMSLFLSVAVFVLVRGWHAFRSVVGMAILLTALGLGLSWLRPSAFAVAAELANATTDYGGRAFGFFLQPNVAAESTIFMYVVWFASGMLRKLPKASVEGLGLVVMVGSTGSRAGILIAVGLMTLLLLDTMQRQTGKTRARWSSGVRLVTGTAAFAIIIAVVGIGVVTIEARMSLSGIGWLLQRDEVSAPGQQVTEASEDASVGLRVFSLQQHATLVAERPFTGYGLGATARLLEAEQVTIATHNEFMEIAVNFGLFYVVLFCALLYGLIKHPQRRHVEGALKSNAYIQIVVVLIVGCLASNTILESRTVIAVVGALQVLLLYPDRWAGGATVRTPAIAVAPVLAGR